MTVPDPHVDGLFDEPADEPLPAGFDESDREFWVHHLDIMCGMDRSELVNRTNRDIWNTVQDVVFND